MIRRILLTGIFAGLLAGAVGFALQAITVTPLILEAEKYEAAAANQGPNSAVAAPGSNGAGSGQFGRWGLSLLANLLTGAGFGLVLAGAIAFSGREPDLKEGVLWGLAGYGIFALAPALMLPPHLPGMAESDVTGRQLLWLATAAATAVGLGLLAFARHPIGRGLGLAALALPLILVILAKPHTDGGAGAPLPAELVAAFVSASLASLAVFWLVLGAAVSAVMNHFLKAPEAP